MGESSQIQQKLEHALSILSNSDLATDSVDRESAMEDIVDALFQKEGAQCALPLFSEVLVGTEWPPLHRLVRALQRAQKKGVNLMVFGELFKTALKRPDLPHYLKQELEDLSGSIS